MNNHAVTIMNKRYELVYKIADGGMGELYYARDLKLNGAVRALKMLKASPDNSNQALWLQQEAHLLTKLRHRCLPHIFDFAESEDELHRPFLVMEWIDGIHLGQLLKQDGHSFTLHYIYKLALEVLEALSYLHAQQPAIIHRDLKPANIMIGKDGAVKLIDFGISKQLGDGKEDTMNFGTKGYAAPEQLQGKGTDERSDIYSFGAIMLAMLGMEPLQLLGGSAGQRELRRKLAAIPKALRQLIIDCLQEQPEHRPQQAGVLLAKMRELAAAGAEHRSFGQDQPDIAKLAAKRAANIGLFANRTVNSKANSTTQRGLKIACVGAHAAAGTTLIALALAECLEQLNYSCAYIEHGGEQHELYYSITGMSDGSRHNAGMTSLEDSGWGEEMELIKAGNGSYYIANPFFRYNMSERISRIGEWSTLHALQQHVIIDYSAAWQAAHIEAMLRHADWIVIVNSPWLMRQPSQGMSKLQGLIQQAAGEHIPVVWISNRDQAFRGRVSWHRLSNGLIHLKVPELSGKIVLNALWNDKGASHYFLLANKFATYLMPLIKKVIRLQ